MNYRKRIVSWLRSESKKRKARGFVVGLSGGVDSAVVAGVCAEAAGRERVLGVLLPCHSHSRDAADAARVARLLKIRTKKVDLGKVYDAVLDALPKAGSPLARANIKPRLRMLSLYYFANTRDYLVCGTGNKSELMVGYFTKYGDGGVDLLPIADLLKRQVRELAAELGIPDDIITKPPSAGLWQGQTDEAEMGMTYDELDSILEALEKGRKPAAPAAAVARVKKMIAASQHKRQLPHICKV